MFLSIAWPTAIRLFAVIGSFLLVLHLLRDITRPLITRLIPIQKRMQPGFLKLQARLSIGTNIGLAALVAFSVHLCCVQLQVWLFPISLPARSEALAYAQPSEVSILPIAENKEKDSLMVSPSPQLPPPVEVEMKQPQVRTYLQIGAYLQAYRALRMQARWHKQSPKPVQVAYMPQEHIPYKVLIGPFNNRQAANNYARQLQVPHFPRSQEVARMQWVQQK